MVLLRAACPSLSQLYSFVHLVTIFGRPAIDLTLGCFRNRSRPRHLFLGTMWHMWNDRLWRLNSLTVGPPTWNSSKTPFPRSNVTIAPSLLSHPVPTYAMMCMYYIIIVVVVLQRGNKPKEVKIICKIVELGFKLRWLNPQACAVCRKVILSPWFPGNRYSFLWSLWARPTGVSKGVPFKCKFIVLRQSLFNRD